MSTPICIFIRVQKRTLNRERHCTPLWTRAMKGRVLLGWLERDRAVKYLQSDCIFDPPLTNKQAEALWAEKRATLEALAPRLVPSPSSLKMTLMEREAAESFLSFVRQQPGGTPEIQSVVKLDPLGLVCRQFFLTLDRANEYTSNVHDAAWSACTCLHTQGALASMNVSSVSNGWNIDLPHGEFMCVLNGQGFGVAECAPYVSVSVIGQRAVLWSGYHRCYARAAAARTSSDRSVLAVLTTAGNATVAAERSLSDLILGKLPPLLGDFLDPRLFLEVELHRKRYELQIRAEVAHINAD